MITKDNPSINSAEEPMRDCMAEFLKLDLELKREEDIIYHKNQEKLIHDLTEEHDRLLEENKRLTEENKRLTEEYDRLTKEKAAKLKLLEDNNIKID